MPINININPFIKKGLKDYREYREKTKGLPESDLFSNDFFKSAKKQEQDEKINMAVAQTIQNKLVSAESFLHYLFYFFNFYIYSNMPISKKPFTLENTFANISIIFPQTPHNLLPTIHLTRKIEFLDLFLGFLQTYLKYKVRGKKDNEIAEYFNNFTSDEIISSDFMEAYLGEDYEDFRNYCFRLNIFLNSKRSLYKNPIINQIKNNYHSAEIDDFYFLSEKKINIVKLKSELKHKVFDQVERLVNLNLPCYLYGETGTGKSFLCEQVAKKLKMDFNFLNSPQDEYKLLGFIDANGVYQKTSYRKAYSEGGLFLLDEIDNIPPEVLVCINSHISGSCADFPDKLVEKHKDFRIICGGNTLGRQDNLGYSARNRLDESSLNRFVIVHFDYDDKLEEELAENNKAFLKFFRDLRDFHENSPIKVSTRTLVYGYTLYKNGLKDFKKLEKLLTGSSGFSDGYKKN